MVATARQASSRGSGASFLLAFGRRKDWRRIATRYDRCATTFFGAITLAVIIIFWLKQ